MMFLEKGRAATGRRDDERGSSLIVAITIITVLTLVGVMVLDQIDADTQLSGSERSAQNVSYAADAGAVWGQTQLSNLVYPAGLATAGKTTPILTDLMALPALSSDDAMCPDPTMTTCTAWYLMTPPASPAQPGWVPFNSNANYRVAATCNPQPCSVASIPVNYSIRSLAQASDGSRRLIEVVIGP